MLEIYAIYTSDVERADVLDLVTEEAVEQAFRDIYESFCKYKCKNRIIHLLDYHLAEYHSDFYKELDENIFIVIEKFGLEKQLDYIVYMLDDVGILSKKDNNIKDVTKEERFMKIINGFSEYKEKVNCPVCKKEISVAIKDILRNG